MSRDYKDTPIKQAIRNFQALNWKQYEQETNKFTGQPKVRFDEWKKRILELLIISDRESLGTAYSYMITTFWEKTITSHELHYFYNNEVVGETLFIMKMREDFLHILKPLIEWLLPIKYRLEEAGMSPYSVKQKDIPLMDLLCDYSGGDVETIKKNLKIVTEARKAGLTDDDIFQEFATLYEEQRKSGRDKLRSLLGNKGS